MQSVIGRTQTRNPSDKNASGSFAIIVGVWVFGLTVNGIGQEASTNATAFNASAPDPVLSLLVEKGMITEQEAARAQAQADAMRTNEISELRESDSQWKISKAVKNIELLGDVRLRYEDRSSTAPTGGSIDLNRFRFAIRLGLRGEAFDDFYYGLRVETSSNPRSTWVTMGTTSSGSTYLGPFNKSAGGIAIGQAYLGWRPASWLDLTLGKMPNPLFTSSMVWSPSINPEGAAERFNYTVGDADLFANFCQFLYADNNPLSAAEGLGVNSELGQSAENIYQIAWQGGLTYHITTNVSAKVGATIYQYFGLQRSTANQGSAPYFGDPYVGEGSYTGPGSGIYEFNGYSGYPNGNNLPGYESLGYPNNQVGLNHLLVLEVPFELNFKLRNLDARIFGDVAYNLQGNLRAQDAASAYAAYLAYQAQQQGVQTISGFAPQTRDNKAYQIGFALGSRDALGLVNGTSTTAKKHAWEVRTFWQHIDQYSLDPNLLDLDYFAGVENMEGVYVAAAYGLTDDFILTFRYGNASRINNLLGTGGTGTDIPQINPVDKFQVLQFDLSCQF